MGEIPEEDEAVEGGEAETEKMISPEQKKTIQK